MAEEEKNGLQTEENTGEANSQTETGTPEKKTEVETVDKTDWEKRYTDLQADHTRVSQRVATFEKETQEREEAAQAEEETGYEDDQFLDRKAVGKMIEKAVLKERSANRMERGDSYFRRAYPDIVKHESIIAGIMRNPKDSKMFDKGVTVEERIDSAVKEFNSLTEEAIATAKTETETEAKEREEKNRKAQGLGGPSTAPAKDDEGKSDAEELADRRAASARKRSPV